MTASFRLRRAGPEDAALLSRLKVAIFRLTYRDLLPAEMLRALGPDDPYSGVAAWRRRLLDEGEDIQVIEVGEPVGYSAVVRPSPPFAGAHAVIDQLYLLPAWQGSRTAQALWRATTEALPRPFGLSAFEGNYRARRFYEGRGGRVAGHLVEFYHRGQPFHEVIYMFDDAPSAHPLRRMIR